MINESKWVNPYHGLELTPDFVEGTRDNENGILFLVEYYFLKSLLGNLTSQDIKHFESIVESLQTYDLSGKQIPGLYDRGARESITHTPQEVRTISRDNLLAIGSFSKFKNLKYANDIFNHGMKNQWRFDNQYPEKPSWSRFMWNIPDIFTMCKYSSTRLGHLISFFGMPLFHLSNIYSILTKYDVRPAWYTRIICWFKGKDAGELRKDIDSSGPWLVFVKMFPLIQKSWTSKLVWKFCTWVLNKQHKEGWKFIAEYYFKHPQHPCRLLMVEAWKKNPYLF